MMIVHVENVSKAYDGKAVLKDVSLTFESGQCYCLMGASGLGKTTLLRLILGLESPDCGQIHRLLENDDSKLPQESSWRFSGVFQEDRLCEHVSAVKNVAMVMNGDRKRELEAAARSSLARILPKDHLDCPVSQLSGGMRRRVAIARAMEASSDFVFMDEPFTGLDEHTKDQVIAYILSARRQRTLLVITHQEADVRKLRAELIRIK